MKAAKEEVPKRGQIWISNQSGKYAKVLSPEPIDGYVMARYKGAMPWLFPVKDWYKKFNKISSVEKTS